MPYAFIPESAIAALPRLSGSAVKVMNAIASFMPGRSAGCYPSLAAIGERAGINREKTISAAIKELTDVGVMVCERRRRQTNYLKWEFLEPAESAGTRILEPAVSAPLDSVLEPAVSAPVYPAVSAPRKVTRKETINTTTPNIFETSIPKDKPKDNSFPQRNPTPPPTPAPSAAEPGKRKAKLKPKANQHPTWRLWLRVNHEAGQPTPLEEKASLAAAKKMASMIPDPVGQEAIMRAYLGDKTDTWAIGKGLTLSILVGSRLSACRAAVAKAAEEQAAEDADLIRQAREQYPDPDECAAFFWARQKRGLRVPPGVDCRPMPGEEEAV